MSAVVHSRAWCAGLPVPKGRQAHDSQGRQHQRGPKRGHHPCYGAGLLAPHCPGIPALCLAACVAFGLALCFGPSVDALPLKTCALALPDAAPLMLPFGSPHPALWTSSLYAVDTLSLSCALIPSSCALHHATPRFVFCHLPSGLNNPTAHCAPCIFA